jgi:hypothetical protein
MKATDHQMPAKKPGAASPAQEGQPTGHDMDGMGAMDHSGGHQESHAMPGMDHATGNKPPGKEMNMENHDQMPGMNSSGSKKHAGDHSGMPAMAGMNHQMPANKQKAKEMGNMSGMDHARRNKAKDQNAAMDHGTMDHGAMGQPAAPAPGNTQPMGNMAGMDHTTMPATGNHQQRKNMGNTKTDMNGRPLIDATQPYDNNPAREQTQHHPKEK